MPDITLYAIEESLQQLMELRDSAETDRERRVIDGQIEIWVQSEISKVDRVRSYLRHLDYTIQQISDDIEARKKYCQLLRDRAKRLRANAVMAMERAGKKRIEGRSGYMQIKGNGGVQSVEVRQPELVPDEYRNYEVRIPGRLWAAACAIWPALPELPRVAMPVLDDIRVALQERCSLCRGTGDYSDIEMSGPDGERCPTCGGTGKRGVPGCVLLPRGSHLEVK